MTVPKKKSVEMCGAVRASNIIGETVVNRRNEKIGKIHELVIDTKKNRIAYVVLSFDGFMGMDNKLFSLPWDAFAFSVSENKLIFNIDKEKLKTAPGFEEGDQWPDFSDTLWGESIYDYYDFTPPWKYDRDPGKMLIEPS